MSITQIEGRAYNGRTLTGTAGQPGWSEIAVEAVQAINRLTTFAGPIPAPVILEVLGNLKRVGYELPQALHQLSHRLSRSSDQDPGSADRDHSPGAAEARELLAEAARQAAQFGVLLEAAQNALEDPSGTDN